MLDILAIAAIGALLIGAGVATVLLWRRQARIAAHAHDLEAQVRWYRNALNFAGIGVWQWDMASDQWWWVEKVFRIRSAAGDVEVPSGNAFLERIHPGDQDRQNAVESACINGQASLRTEYRYVLESGEERWLRDVGDVIRDADGVATQMLGITLDVTAERQSLIDYERRSVQDELTGMHNRRALAEFLPLRIGTLDEGRALVIGFMDLNGFKAVNDRLGHAAGDECLRRIGTAFRSCCEEGEFSARFGGDEFVLVLECDGGAVASGIGRMRFLVQEILGESRAGDAAPELGAAVGVACYPDHGRDAESLVESADRAMYVAKASGDTIAVVVCGARTGHRGTAAA